MFSWMDRDHDKEITRDECVAHLLMRAKGAAGEDITAHLPGGDKAAGGMMGGMGDMGGLDPAARAKLMSMMGGKGGGMMGGFGGMGGGFQSMEELEARSFTRSRLSSHHLY